MAFNSFSANAFASNFMAGFSFVDQIKKGKKNEARLESRLAEEKEARTFQRKRTLEADQQVRDDRAVSAEDRERITNERNQRASGEKAALSPDSSDEELLQFAPFSPGAAAELKRRIGDVRFQAALDTAQSIPTQGTQVPNSGTQTLSDGVTQLPGDQAQLAAADPTAQAQAPAAESPAGAGDGFQFGRDRGEGSLQPVTEEVASANDPEFRNKGFIATALDVAGGQASQTIRAGADAVGAAFTAAEGVVASIRGMDRITSEQNVGDEFTGTIQVPADLYTDPEEFEALQAQGVGETELRLKREQNEKIFADYKKAGEDPSNFGMTEPLPLSRQGKIASGSGQALSRAQQVSRSVETRYGDFADPSKASVMSQLAEEDPTAAAALYMDERATLESTNPTLALSTDRRMVPVLNQAELTMQSELGALEPGSPSHSKKLRSLSNLQTSRDIIAKGQPSVAAQYGIKPQGLKQGDAVRAGQVVDGMFDEGRSVVTQQQPAAINAASTMAGRITPGGRLNTNQIQALSVLAEAGWIDKATAMSVAMTGAWPPGQDPNGIKKIQEAGGVVYATRNNGAVSILPNASAKPKESPSTEITTETLGWAMEGASFEFPNMDDRRKGQFSALINNNAGWIRSRFVVTSQEQMRSMGSMFAQSVLLSAKENQRREDSFFSTSKNSPTPEEIFFNPVLADELATRFDVDLLEVPPVKNASTNVDHERIKQSFRNGDFGPNAAANADAYTNEEVEYIVNRRGYMAEQAEATRVQ